MGPSLVGSLSSVTNVTASATGAVRWKDGAAAGDGSSAAPSGSRGLAAGLEELIAGIAMCPVDALNRDRGIALDACLRHRALRLKGINPSSRHPLICLSTVNPLSHAGLKHGMKCSHFRALWPTLCVCRSLLSSVKRRVFCTRHSSLSSLKLTVSSP